jgi:hypothetical protein
LNQKLQSPVEEDIQKCGHRGNIEEPFKPYSEQLLAKGLRPELARLTLARKIAAITLAVWKKGERFNPEKLTKLAT